METDPQTRVSICLGIGIPGYTRLFENVAGKMADGLEVIPGRG